MADTPRKAPRKTAQKAAKKTAKRPAARKNVAAKKSDSVKTAGKAAKDSSKPTSAKHKHAQLVRDSFTIPENEYALLAETKKACLAAGFEIKKSELIRIGIAMVHELGTSKIKKAHQVLQPVKTGRPKKHK